MCWLIQWGGKSTDLWTSVVGSCFIQFRHLHFNFMADEFISINTKITELPKWAILFLMSTFMKRENSIYSSKKLFIQHFIIVFVVNFFPIFFSFIRGKHKTSGNFPQWNVTWPLSHNIFNRALFKEQSSIEAIW
jgi:hypothetical protein